MKRLLCSCMVIFIMAIFAAVSHAGESAFFDAGNDWLIRAYYNNGNVYLEVRNTDKSLVPAGEIAGLDTNPKQVASGASSPDVSLGFDTVAATAYVFYTNASGLQLVAQTGIAPGGGSPNIFVNPTNLVFGNVTVGQTSDKTVQVSNTGGANLVLGTITVTGTYFSRVGGTCSSGQTLGPGANCNINVRFSPSAEGNFFGNLAIPSNDEDVNVPLSGTGVASQCNPDLLIASARYIGCGYNNQPCSVDLTIQNNGSCNAGSFRVKGYFSMDTQPGPIGRAPDDTLLFTWDVSGLGAGSSLSNTLSGTYSGYSAHAWYYVIVWVDADQQIPEANEGNNITYKAVYVAR